MPPSEDQVSPLLASLWACVERAGALEDELRSTAEALASWQQIARAALAALDQEIGRRREADATRTIA